LSKPSKYAQELKTLQAAYDKTMKEFAESLSPLPPAEQERVFQDPAKSPSRGYADKALALAARAKGTPVEVQAKVFAMQAARGTGAPTLRERTLGESILKDVLANHITSPDIRPVLFAIIHPETPNVQAKATAARRLRMIEAKSPHAPVRAQALMGQIELVYDTYNGTGDETAARQLAQRLARQYGNTIYYGNTTYRAAVEGLLFQMDRLAVGKAAPDIEGEDQDGARFKLSDYRGKVVVLEFWGFW
jgi:hypothetical protein